MMFVVLRGSVIGVDEMGERHQLTADSVFCTPLRKALSPCCLVLVSAHAEGVCVLLRLPLYKALGAALEERRAEERRIEEEEYW